MFRRLCVVQLVYLIVTVTEGDILTGFLRTLIRCPTPVPDEHGRCPRGSHLEGGGCEPVPRGDDAWSGSAYCADQNLVVTEAQSVQGSVMFVILFGQLFANLVVANAIIDLLGRKIAILIALGGSSLCMVLLGITCMFHRKAIVVLLLGGLASSATNCFDAATLAMSSDISASQGKDSGSGYGTLRGNQFAAAIVSLLVAYVILLQDLTDYTFVFGAFAVLGFGGLLFTTIFLKETSGCDAPAREGTRSRCRGLSEMMLGFRLIARDRFTWMTMVAFFFSGASTFGILSIIQSYVLSVVGYSQANASICVITQPVCGVVGAMIFKRLLPRFGANRLCIAGQCLAATCMFTIGLCAPFRSFAKPIFWIGWSLLGIGWGVVGPAEVAMIGSRVDKSCSGRVFAVVSIMTVLGGSIASPIWSNVLFKGAAPGWKAGLPFFVACISTTSSMLWNLMNYVFIILPEQRGQLLGPHGTSLPLVPSVGTS